MLETKIEALTQAIVELSEQINKLNANMDRVPGDMYRSADGGQTWNLVQHSGSVTQVWPLAKADTEEVLADTEEVLADTEEVLGDTEEVQADTEEVLGDTEEVQTEAKEVQTEAEAKPKAEAVSLDELQRFVLNLVREKRHLRDQIKALVQEITGVNFMHDVPADKAGELKAAIENLVSEEGK